MTAPLPLDGYRVVDLTVDRGELCGRLLADLGADVIKVEPPEGSPARRLAPLHDGVSLFFAVRNAGKRGVVAEGERLEELLAHADVAIVNEGAEEIAARHPHLVVTAITPYGLHDQWSDRLATEGVLAATSTVAFKAGVPEKDPLMPPASFVDDCASVAFAFGTLTALWQGGGQVLDCSVNEAMANQADWGLPNNSVRMFVEDGPVREVRSGAGPIWPSFRCADGFVRVVILSPRQWHAMRAWLGEPEYLQDPALDTFPGRFAITEAVINPLISELFADKNMDDISTEAQARGIVCTPLAKPADVLGNAHFQARGSLVDVDLGGGLRGPIPSGFLEVDGERAGPVVGPPAVGQHTDEVFASLGERRTGGPASGPALPLADLRVADFGHGGVGVEIGRMFAEYGAEVLKIESRTYPDFIRVQTGGEMSPSFASSSRSKKGFAANAKSPEGHDVLLRLLDQCDVVIENNSTGVMDDMGLGYSTLAARNEGIVMLSSQLMGSRGPWADFRGYGPSTRAAGGLEMLWNYDDQDEPAGGATIFPDHLCGRVGALGALAGLLARRRSGRGAHVELAQVEVTVGIVGDLLTKEALTPGSVRATGNRRERGAPWGLFRCAGDEQWAAITVEDDAQWASLAGLLGVDDPSLATAAARFERIDEVEGLVRAWTAEVSREDVVAQCQTAGVPAGEMLTALESASHPRFQARDFAVEVEQPGVASGRILFDNHGFLGSAMAPITITRAPFVGEHTRAVARDLLGMPDDEIQRLVEAVVLEVTEP